MQSLRSVITQATRGGRLVLSRRNFSSSSVGKETNGAVESFRESLNDPWGHYAAGALLYFGWEYVQRRILLQELHEAKKRVKALR